MMKYLLVTQSLMPIQSGTFLPSLVLVSSFDALVAVLEADEQHDDGNDGVEDGNLDPCLLGVTQTGDEREGNGGDDHVAEGGHTGTEQVDNGALVGVAGHQGSQRCIRKVECGVDNGGAEVIGDENVDALDDRGLQAER